MAIVEMKKLRLIAPRSRGEELLRVLIRLGCVEISELDAEKEGLSGIVEQESTDLTAIRDTLHTLDSAVAILDRYAPSKKGKALKAVNDENILLNDTGIRGAMRTASVLREYDARLKALTAEENRISTLITALEPWTKLDLALNTDSTDTCSVFIGCFSAKTELEPVEKAVAELDERAELFCVNEDKRLRYMVFVCLKEYGGDMLHILRRFGFSPAPFGDIDCTAREYISRSGDVLRRLSEEKEKCRRFITDERVRRELLRLAADRMRSQLHMAEVAQKMHGTETVLVISGWVPASREKELERIFFRLGCAWEMLSPTPQEYDSVPVKLENNSFTNALNMVTNTYGLPRYGSLDPNPLMAPFFVLFYGLMMADMGYGAIMILAALIAMINIRPGDRGALSFCQLLAYCGVSTFIVGAMTGGFFGDALVKIGELTGRGSEWGQLPRLFDPLNDTIYIMLGAVALGLIQLNVGMVAGFVKKLRRGQVLDAVFEEGSLWVTLIGIVLYIFKLGNFNGIPLPLCLGLIMLFYGGSRHAKGFGKLLSVFATLYNTSTGWFGDILSYTRIMALMLAGTVISTVFNTIGAIANSLWLFIPVFIIGHTLNFGLNLLGCYVHDLRLQCLEYFGKFYEEGGKPFKPLKIETKYHEIRPAKKAATRR